MSKKLPTFEETLNYVTCYHRYVLANSPFIKPTEGQSSGSAGNLFEMEIKLSLGNYRFVGVAKRGRPDTYKKINGKRVVIECKTGGGELNILDCNGDIVEGNKPDWYFYCPEFFPELPAEQQVYCITYDDFMTFLDENNLRARKYSTAMGKRKKAGQPWYYDRIGIQNFRSSPKRYEAVLDSLDKYGMSFKAWQAMMGLK